MRLVYTAAVAAALLAPVLAAAQPAFPDYVGPVTTYAAHGCSTGGTDPSGAPVANALCLDGFVTIGRIAQQNPLAPSTSAISYYDLTVTRAAAFTPSVLLFNDDGGFFSGYMAGRYFEGTTLIGRNAMPADLDFTAPPPSLLGEPHVFEFLYRYPDTPAIAMPEADVRLRLTATPEPATLALTLGGLAVLGAGAWRRRR